MEEIDKEKVLSNRLINFNYEGKSYEVDMRAYNTNLVQLPEGEILEIGSWLERYPPIPQHILKTENNINNEEKAISARLTNRKV